MDIAICAVSKGEMYTGSFKSSDPQRSRAIQDAFFVRFVTLPFDDVAADAFGRLRATLEQAGTPIGPYDMQIAAIALVHQLIVVTHNSREFRRVLNLQVDDWEAD
jgi:tRNA(fMet)-specific endonuclease VapC